MQFHDFIGGKTGGKTSDHYTDQWSLERGMGTFMTEGQAAPHTMQFVLGWRGLFDRIREQAASSKVSVYDAACGYGGIMHTLFDGGNSTGLSYTGADIRANLQQMPVPPGATPSQILLARHDISDPLPLNETFDFIVCRNAIHHTPDPRKTFASLRRSLKPGGTIAISAYSKKARLREALDDAMRAAVVPMDNEAAFKASSDFTELGRALRQVTGTVTIGHDLEFLGIRAGTYGVQDLIYNHIVKFWYNEAFGPERSDVVNFDWYHPPYAYRSHLDELTAWYTAEGLSIDKTDTHPSQHYVEGRAFLA